MERLPSLFRAGCEAQSVAPSLARFATDVEDLTTQRPLNRASGAAYLCWDAKGLKS